MFIVPLSSLPALQPVSQAQQDTSPSAGAPFSAVMRQAMEELEASQRLADQDAYGLVTGDVADLHTVMIHSAQQAASVEAVVQLTSRAVSAYKEIMQMQI